MKDQFKESKAFLKSKKSSSPGIFKAAAKFITPFINQMFSPINLAFIKPVWSLLTSFGITFLRRFAIALAAIL